MKQVTVVTGPLRSGTSCITGILERCGFDLGRNVRVLRKESQFNPKGHFELDLLYAINERLILESDGGRGDIFNGADHVALTEIAKRRERYFRLFLNKFDGNLCKDPLFCLTLPFWKTYWQAEIKTVFCLRHPYAVAKSMAKRYAVSEELALRTWRTYAERFFDHIGIDDVFVIDFDCFIHSPKAVFDTLLSWLDKTVDPQLLETEIELFFSSGFVHWQSEEAELSCLYPDVMPLYLRIKQRAEAQQLVYQRKSVD